MWWTFGARAEDRATLESAIEVFRIDDFGLMGECLEGGEGQGFVFVEEADFSFGVFTDCDLGIAQGIAGAGALNLVVGPGVLRETEEVLRRKAPHLLGTLAQLLDEVNLEVCEAPELADQQRAGSLLAYAPDAQVLAQALHASPDWLASHDKEHFLGNPALAQLSFKIGSPGDVLEWVRENR